VSVIEASIPQILSVWTELEDARLGVHGFGSSTAEIYAYRLLPHSPLAAANAGTLSAAAQEVLARVASRSLAAILDKFMELRPRVTITVDGFKYRPGRTELPPCFHRWHIEVVEAG
jgi:hypothetical protein